LSGFQLLELVREEVERVELAVATIAYPAPEHTMRSTVAVHVLPARVVIWTLSPTAISAVATLAPHEPSGSFAGEAEWMLVLVVMALPLLPASPAVLGSDLVAPSMILI
jgi:hypothetical protein